MVSVGGSQLLLPKVRQQRKGWDCSTPLSVFQMLTRIESLENRLPFHKCVSFNKPKSFKPQDHRGNTRSIFGTLGTIDLFGEISHNKEE